MSFSELLTKAVNSVVVSFIDTVSKRYDISKDELVQIFNGDVKNKVESKPSEVSKKTTEPVVALQPSDELNKMNKNELIAHCKTKGLKTTGTKQELIDRLTCGAPPVASEKEKKTSPSKTKTPPVEPTVVRGIQSSIQTVQIKKNSFGNYEHPDTNLVFDRVNQKAIGKQNKSGKIDSLTDEDIETCNKYKFKYDIPENLNLGVKNSVAIEGLEEEEEIDDDDGADIINEAEELLEEEELEDDGGAEEEFFEDDE
jgi:hypothetical protein